MTLWAGIYSLLFLTTTSFAPTTLAAFIERPAPLLAFGTNYKIPLGANKASFLLHRTMSALQASSFSPTTGQQIVISSSDLGEATSVGMSQTYDKIAHGLVQTFGERSKNNKEKRQRLWVGMVGAPGSGKTTVSEAVIERINKQVDGPKAIAIPMDGFHFSQKEMKELGYEMKKRGAPWTFDATKMYEILKVARDDDNDGQDVWLPDYSREISDPVPNKIKLDASVDIVIIEGLYLMLGSLCQEVLDPQSPTSKVMVEMGFVDNASSDELKRWELMMALWDQTYFIEPPCGFDENKRRLVERSLKTWTPAKTELWGGGTAREAATRRVEMNDALNARLVNCCKPYATHIIEST